MFLGLFEGKGLLLSQEGFGSSDVLLEALQPDVEGDAVHSLDAPEVVLGLAGLSGEFHDLLQVVELVGIVHVVASPSSDAVLSQQVLQSVSQRPNIVVKNVVVNFQLSHEVDLPFVYTPIIRDGRENVNGFEEKISGGGK